MNRALDGAGPRPTVDLVGRARRTTAGMLGFGRIFHSRWGCISFGNSQYAGGADQSSLVGTAWLRIDARLVNLSAGRGKGLLGCRRPSISTNTMCGPPYEDLCIASTIGDTASSGA